MHIESSSHDHAHQLGSSREQRGVERTQRGRTEQSRDTERAHRGRTEHARGAERAHRRHAEHARGTEGAHRRRSEHAERERLERSGPQERMRIEGENETGRSLKGARRELHDVAHEVRHEVRSFMKENPELDDEARYALRSVTRDLHEDVHEVMHELRHGGFEDRTELAETVRGVFAEYLSGLREIQASLEAPADTGSESTGEAASGTANEGDGATTTTEQVAAPASDAASAETTSQAVAVELASDATPTVPVPEPASSPAEQTTETAMTSMFEGLIAQFQQQVDRFEGMLQQWLSHASEEHGEADDDAASALEARIEETASLFARYTADHLETSGSRVDSIA